MSNGLYSFRYGWLASWIGVALYPVLIILFPQAINGYRDSGSLLFAGYAVILMILAGSIPLTAARTLIRMRQASGSTSSLERGLLYVMFAVSPLYVLTILLAWAAGAGRYHTAIWISVWVMIGTVVHLWKPSGERVVGRAAAAGLRIIHGATALCLLGGFLIAHLANHDLALWSTELHSAVMEWLRHWYRSKWVEPILLGLFGVMIGTGIPLVAHHSRRNADAFRIVQMATGVYIAMFLGAHLFAVLGARSNGVETDWFFATGPRGLLNGRGMLIPYYVLAVFFLILHGACGLRIVLLKHSVSEGLANKSVYAIAAVGVAVTLLIAIAAFGFHIQD